MRSALFFASRRGALMGDESTGHRTPGRAPADLDKPGAALWKRIAKSGFEFREDELEVLAEACRTADELATLKAALSKLTSPTTAGSMGQTVGHPLFAEVRAHRALLSRLLARLGLTSEEDGVVGARSAAARALANERWRRGA